MPGIEYEGHQWPGKKWPVMCWGHSKLPKAKGLITYTMSANMQRPLAGALHNAIFNTWRRTMGQVLYVVPPFVVAYFLVDWANERNKYLNSKEGRLAERAAEQ